MSPKVESSKASKTLSGSPSVVDAGRQGAKRRKCVERARQKKRTVLSDSESDRGVEASSGFFVLFQKVWRV